MFYCSAILEEPLTSGDSVCGYEVVSRSTPHCCGDGDDDDDDDMLTTMAVDNCYNNSCWIPDA